MADIRADAPERISLDDLVSAQEISERCDCEVVTVRKWRDRYEDYPEPIIVFSSGPLWDWREIAKWLKKPRAAGRPGTWDKMRAAV